MRLVEAMTKQQTKNNLFANCQVQFISISVVTKKNHNSILDNFYKTAVFSPGEQIDLGLASY